jgi:phospholipase D-like protein
MEWWEFLLVLVLVLPIMALWVGCIIDAISRPDLGGVAKALWILAMLFFPLIGCLIYVIMRPRIPMATAGTVDSVWGSTPDSVPTTMNNPDTPSVTPSL